MSEKEIRDTAEAKENRCSECAGILAEHDLSPMRVRGKPVCQRCANPEIDKPVLAPNPLLNRTKRKKQ